MRLLRRRKPACRVTRTRLTALSSRRAEKTAILQNYYIRLGKVRRSTDCLKEGEFIPVSSVLSCVCFERRGKNDSCLLIANRNEQDITYYLPPRWQNTSEVLLGESVGSGSCAGAVGGHTEKETT